MNKIFISDFIYEDAQINQNVFSLQDLRSSGILRSVV